MKFRIIISPAAEKFMMRMPPRDCSAVRQAIDSLADDPWGGNTNAVVGSDYWRLRVRSFRVIYSVDGKQKLVVVERVARRNEKTYRGL